MIKKFCVFLLTFFIILFASGCASDNLEGAISNAIKENADKLIVHYIDVGQGDSTFIEFPNSETMLIDAGESEYGNVVTSYIKSLGYSKIDYLIGTHPHSDHIGGLKAVVNSFDLGKVYMPRAASTTSTYLNLLKAIDNKSMKVTTAKAKVEVLKTDDLSVKILAPTEEEYSNLNNYSVVLKITYKDRSFLFTGDAEKAVEDNLSSDIKSDVIKIPHHGSDSSSSIEFVKKVAATYAIVSVGKDNSYDHPSKDVLKRWESSGAKIYRTDEEGTIIVKTDGESIEIKTHGATVNKDDVKEDEHEEEKEISLVSLSNPIIKGENATIKIKGKANTEYKIKVMYKSGASTASGLEDKKSDQDGYVSWTWKVSERVTPGTYEIIVSSKTSEEIFEYEIKE